MAASKVAFGLERKSGVKPGEVKRNFVLPAKKKTGPVATKNKDNIQDLLGSLNKQPKFSKMVIYSVGCLDKLAVDAVAAEELITEGCVETFMMLLKANPGDETIAAAVQNCLKNLCKNPRLAQMVADRINGNYKPFADSLNESVTPEALMTTAHLLGHLTRGTSPETIEQMSRSGIHAALCGVIVKNKGNRKLLEAAAEALSRFGADSKRAPMILHSGAVEEILKQVQLHPEDLQLVKPAVALIAGMAKASKEVREPLKKMGAVDVVVTALEVHPYNDELLASAAEALKHLTGATDMGLALAAVTKGDTALDAKTAAALSKIATLMLVPENVDYLHKNAGIDWLTSILKGAVGKDDSVASKILANGCRVLMRAASDPTHVYDILKKGGVPLLISILKGHSGDDRVIESALCAMAKLVTSKDNAIYVANCGAIKAAIQALKDAPESEAIARSALELFTALAQFPEMGDTLCKAGVIKSTMDILKHHLNNAELCQAAILALGRMATSAPNVQEMLNSGLLPTLLGVLKKHPDNREVVSSTLMALETACLVPEAAGKLKELGAIPLIKETMEHHPDDEEIQTVGSALMDLCSVDVEAAKAKALEDAKAEAEEEERVERERMARLEVGRKEKERQAQLEQEKAAEIARKEQERQRRLREADEARLRAERDENERLEAEMAAAMEAMKASSDAARLRAVEEQKKQREMEQGKIAAEMEAAKLKAMEDQRKLEEIEKKRRELELLRKKASQKKEEDAATRHIHQLASRTGEKQKEETTRVKLKKSARELFEPDDEKDKKLAVLPPPIKNFLLAGALLKKHSKKALPKPKHVYLSPDLEWIVWKDPSKSDISIKQRFKIYKLYGVNAGRCTMQLQRKRLGRYLAKEECCFSVYGADSYKDERTVDLEAPSPKEAQAWIHAFEVLIEYAKNRSLYGGSTVAMRTDKELDKMGHKGTKAGGGGDDDDEGVVWAGGAEDPDDEGVEDGGDD